MKLTFILALGLTIALQCVQASSKSDAELSRQLVGSWPNGVPRGIITFSPDHTFQGFLIPSIAKIPPARVEIKGSWRIEDGVLMGSISSSSVPCVPTGKMKPIRIISISSSDSVMQDSKGKKERFQRARIPSVLPPLLSPDICLFLHKTKISKAVMERSVLERPQPTYPPAAVRDRKTGSGAFAIFVDKSTGRVESVRTLISTGHEILDAAARDALAKWRFKSDSVDKLAVPVDFKLSPRGPLGIFGL